MMAVVDPEAGAATVTSWSAPAVLASSLARVAGHAVAARCVVALAGGVVAWGFGLAVAVAGGRAAVAGGGVTLGGGVVAVAVVALVASAAGFTDAGGAGVTAGSTPGFTGEAQALARRAIPSAAATAVRCGLKAVTRHGNKTGRPRSPIVLLMEIRLATPADAIAIHAIYAPIVSSTPISFELEPPTVEEMAARITAVLPTYPWLVLTDGGGVAGYAYGRPYQARPAYRWSVETSVYIEDGRRGAGLGGALYRSLLDVLARQGYRQALAGVALPNPASVGLHQACGFRLTGVQERLGWKLGAWHDVGWFQRELAPGSGAPAAPIALNRLAPGTLAAALQLGAQPTGSPL